MTFAVTVTTGDSHPGAEPVDAITAALLDRGFTLLTRLDPDALLAAPLLPGWWGELSNSDRLQIAAPRRVALRR
ncbi:hypothetical protein [Pseudonocardia parietis]|uniref:Uncharacterized protein n=1 Tax=Pseudonocardia parietis TaxID=570936 RepID=A0ABS4W6Q1_9PSEU|nr:hypothetical protein [Pseudonocardia parietis]MBP2371666.1 hypothetical protein [Pseudonocardia parietis]